MSAARSVLRQSELCLRCQMLSRSILPFTQFRSFSTSPTGQSNAEVQTVAPDNPPFSASKLSLVQQEKKALKSGVKLVGSRRRRAALQSSTNIPFEQLPYQCFQEALKILREDREEKIQKINLMRGRIARLLEQDPSVSGGEEAKQRRLLSMRKELEGLKILADINDPLVKKRFEDGKGDMNKPIYRYLADKKWRSYKRLVIVQRITQMHVVPDILAKIDPVAEVTLSFSGRTVQPGQFVQSRTSETPPKLKVQVFDKGERLVSVAVIDPDVPNVEKDGFDSRCHFLASNIAISPTSGIVDFQSLSKDDQVILPWLPPFSQKGSPYHRLAIIVLQQKAGAPIDVSSVASRTQRDGFSLRAFVAKTLVKPVGAHLFRAVWDEGTADVMRRAGFEGAHIEFKRQRIEPLPYKKKDGARFR